MNHKFLFKRKLKQRLFVNNRKFNKNQKWILRSIRNQKKNYIMNPKIHQKLIKKLRQKILKINSQIRWWLN